MILVVNAGSSSIKFRLYSLKNTEPSAVLEGIAERIGLDGNLEISYQNQKLVKKLPMLNHGKAVKAIYNQLEELRVLKSKQDIQALGFRVVHGGSLVNKPTLITPKIKEIIHQAARLAPLHNPGSLVAIEAFEKEFPTAKLVACFDTAFHQTMPMINYLYPVPYEWYEKYQVRKFGFHGISYEYITQKMAQILQKPIAELNLIVAHLGNGASITAIKNGQSLDTTMGLTPLAGLMMGTRSGDIDPSIIQYMAKTLDKDVFEITEKLNKRSGLLGLSNFSSDMRDLEVAAKNGAKLPQLALEKYCDEIADFIVKFANKLTNKIDAIVFTAGIGENSATVRQEVVNRLPLLKLEILASKNLEKYLDAKLISTPKSQFPIYAVRTNEELLICQQTFKLTSEEKA